MRRQGFLLFADRCGASRGVKPTDIPVEQPTNSILSLT